MFEFIIERAQVYSSKVNWFVFCSIFCFTIGAWLDINGLWCETVIMVHELPEGWKLPSILSASTQIAQIGPIFFLLGKRFAPNTFTYERAIYTILFIGATSCFLLSFFWDAKATLFGHEVSLGLYILNFSLAILDGTSSVTFLPYIGGNFAKEYMIPNYIGESLAALVPSSLALAQGLGQNPGCHNVTRLVNGTNVTTTEAIPIVPNYSVQVYFLLMFTLLVISTLSFSFLHFSSTAISARKSYAISSPFLVNNQRTPKNRINNNPVFDASISSNDSNTKQSICSNQTLISNSPETPKNSESEQHIVRSYAQYSVQEKREITTLLTLVFMLSFICYGVLPGLQSYSTLPYGNDIYNYSVNFSFIFLPLAIILSIWSYSVSVIQIVLEFIVATGFSIYIVILSLMSPCPPFLLSWLGPALTIISWILSQSMFMRIRCLIATRLERFGQTILLILGALTMFGQIFGGLIIFVVVNIYDLLKARDECPTQTVAEMCNL